MNHQGDDQNKDQQVPRDDEEAKKQGEQNRKEMDEVPPHGTDPLHEGP